MIKKILISSLIILTGCSTPKPSYVKTSGIVVDVEREVINKTDINTKAAQSILGPSPKVIPRKKTKKKEPTKIVGAIFGPGINRSIGHVAFLKGIKTKNVKINIVSGVGLGAVTATLFAKGEKPDSIEWFYYKFFNEVKEVTPYSTKWRKILIDQIKNEFGNLTFEELKLACSIPLYANSNGEVKYIMSGSIVNALKSAILIYPSSLDNEYISPMKKSIFGKTNLTEIGADVVYAVNVLGNSVKFVDRNEFLMLNFGVTVNIVKKEKDSIDFFFDLPMEDMFYDATTMLPKSLQKSYSYTLNRIEELKSEKKKQEDSSF